VIDQERIEIDPEIVGAVQKVLDGRTEQAKQAKAEAEAIAQDEWSKENLGKGILGALKDPLHADKQVVATMKNALNEIEKREYLRELQACKKNGQWDMDEASRVEKRFRASEKFGLCFSIAVRDGLVK
jgi:hypothetical protein